MVEQQISEASALRAYVLRDRHDDEAGAVVVFARTAREARQHGMDDVEYIDVAARRAPEFDAHAPGPVPLQALLDAGWHWECGGCHHQVDADGCWRCAPPGLPEPEPPIVTERDAYCGPVCEARDQGRMRGHRLERAEREAAEAEARRRWPDATVVWCGWNRPAWGEPPPAEWRIYVRLWLRARDAYATWWAGDRDHEGLEFCEQAEAGHAR